MCSRHSNDPNVDERNCSECKKCNRTLVALDALGKLDEYSSIFDLSKYYKNKKKIFLQLAANYESSPFSKDDYDFCKENGVNMPSLKIGYAAKKVKKIINFLGGKK